MREDIPMPVRKSPAASTVAGQKTLLKSLFTRLQTGLNAPPETSEIKDLNALLTLFEKLNALHNAIIKSEKPKATVHDTHSYRAELTQRLVSLQSGDTPRKPRAGRPKTFVE
jgi:hypothetical protein